jgi:hypothetical protein
LRELLVNRRERRVDLARVDDLLALVVDVAARIQRRALRLLAILDNHRFSELVVRLLLLRFRLRDLIVEFVGQCGILLPQLLQTLNLLICPLFSRDRFGRLELGLRLSISQARRRGVYARAGRLWNGWRNRWRCMWRLERLLRDHSRSCPSTAVDQHKASLPC